MEEARAKKAERPPLPERIISRTTGSTLDEKLDSLIVEEELHRPNRVPFRKKPPTHVVTVRLTDGDFQELTELKAMTSEKTLSGVVLTALATYDFVVEQLTKGREIWVVDPSGTEDTG